MSEERIREIEALVTAATEGPWVVWQGDNDPYWEMGDPPPDKLWNVDTEDKWVARKVWEQTDAEFIAASRTIVPELLAALKAEQARAERAEALVGELEGVLGGLVAAANGVLMNAPSLNTKLCMGDQEGYLISEAHMTGLSKAYWQAVLPKEGEE